MKYKIAKKLNYNKTWEVGSILQNDMSYNLIKTGINVSSLRQKMGSSNIANANTPDYKVNRVEFEELLSKQINEIGMNTTHNGHLGKLTDIKPRVVKRETTYLNDNGNNVDIDIEMTELAANELYYSTLVKQINQKLSGLNLVINRT